MDPTTPTTSVPETSPAARLLEPVPYDEATPPADGEFSLGDTLGSQIARTDAALVAWRDESVRRRAEYEETLALGRAEAERRRRRMIGLGLGAGAVGALTAATLAVVFAVAFRPESNLAERAPATIARPPVAAPPVAAPPVAAPIVAAPTTPVAAPVAAIPAAVAPVVVEPPAVAASTGVGAVRVWSDQRHVWVAFRTAEPGALRLHWKDARGVEVLEPMRCASSDCRVGRSHGRIASALAAGAAPGTWTIEACGAGGCAAVGTFAAGADAR